MRVIEQGYEVLDISPTNPMRTIELAARTCYKSEDKISDSSAETLIKALIRSGHHTPLEMANVNVKLITDRGVLAELTRHRVGISFCVESTRYVNYSKDKFGNEITVIKPCFWSDESPNYQAWVKDMEYAEKAYMRHIRLGATAEQARSVLPMSLKTEITMSVNFRALRHIFDLRCSPKAHPQIKQLFVGLRDEMTSKFPVVFGTVYL